MHRVRHGSHWYAASYCKRHSSANDHQAGVTASGGGVDAQGVFDQQMSQRNIGFTLVEAMHTDELNVTWHHTLHSQP